ncbi:MAG: hypothetical protein Satyrvirus20_17 [Satyrvirus sp.]|uniref:Uncharacterized protein n=1 Tax=Satyrvirus sp. TaxID=2487771 RepID=A0A3G5AEA3_9VIRU|nr:MAG: hypothetical protein Satyrvirus20_17 [Satyrvirus sp.]
MTFLYIFVYFVYFCIFLDKFNMAILNIFFSIFILYNANKRNIS